MVVVTIRYQLSVLIHVTGALYGVTTSMHPVTHCMVHWEMSADHETTVVYQTYIDEQEMATTRQTIQCTFRGRVGECSRVYACMCMCVCVRVWLLCT